MKDARTPGCRCSRCQTLTVYYADLKRFARHAGPPPLNERKAARLAEIQATIAYASATPCKETQP